MNNSAVSPFTSHVYTLYNNPSILFHLDVMGVPEVTSDLEKHNGGSLATEKIQCLRDQIFGIKRLVTAV